MVELTKACKLHLHPTHTALLHFWSRVLPECCMPWYRPTRCSICVERQAGLVCQFLNQATCVEDLSLYESQIYCRISRIQNRYVEFSTRSLSSIHKVPKIRKDQCIAPRYSFLTHGRRNVLELPVDGEGCDSPPMSCFQGCTVSISLISRSR